MYQRILVPLDGSLLAERALPLAVALVQRSMAQLVLLRVAETTPDLGDTQTPDKSEEQSRAETYLHDLSARLTDPHGSPALDVTRVRYLAPVGERDKTLLSTIAEAQPDIIVMTTHARSGLPRLALGSVANTLVRRAGVPTLLLHPDRSEDAPILPQTGTILVTLDRSPEAEAILPVAQAMAQDLGYSLALLSIVTPVPAIVSMGQAGVYVDERADQETAEILDFATTYLASIQKRVVEAGLLCTAEARIGIDVAASIEQYAHTAGVSLVAMATHARGRLGDVILGSVADSVLRQGNTPVLVCHSLPPVPVTPAPVSATVS